MDIISFYMNMIPESVKPYVAFALATALVWHFYGNLVKSFIKSLQLNNKREAA